MDSPFFADAVPFFAKFLIPYNHALFSRNKSFFANKNNNIIYQS
jgi:hypothetical protein